MTVVCRETLISYLTNGQRPECREIPAGLEKPRPVFVTFRKGKATRGCAGTFYPTQTNLRDELVEFTIRAAAEDFRYPPVTRSELDRLTIIVTLPNPPVPIDSLTSYNSQREGLIVRKNGKEGVALPGEAKTAAYALKICLRNAGLENAEGAALYKFTATTFVKRK
jgi:AMMECR1 domain-containing protein